MVGRGEGRLGASQERWLGRSRDGGRGGDGNQGRMGAEARVVRHLDRK